MPWVRKTMGTQRHCLTFLVWGKCVSFRTCPCLPFPHGDIPAGALRLTGLWGESRAAPAHGCLSEMSGQLLEDGSRVYTEGTVLHGYSGYREELLPALHGPKQNLHGGCGLLVLWRRKSPGSWTRISSLFAWLFPMCKTLHRAQPASWGSWGLVLVTPPSAPQWELKS